MSSMESVSVAVADDDVPKVTGNVMKLLIIGDTGVGKTCFLFQWAERAFNSTHIPTIGVDYKDRIVRLNGRTYDVEIWDSAGQTRFDAVTAQFYRRAEGVIVVFDLTNADTFKSIHKWFDKIKDNTSSDVPVVLVGNKSDSRNRTVEATTASMRAQDFHVEYFDCSSKNNENVDEAVLHLCQLAIERRRKREAMRKAGKKTNHSASRTRKDNLDEPRISKMGSFLISDTSITAGGRRKKKKKCTIL